MSTVGVGVRDEAWLRSLFKTHHPAVRAYALRRVPDVAVDVVSEVFTVAWRRQSDVRTTPSPGCTARPGASCSTSSVPMHVSSDCCSA